LWTSTFSDGSSEWWDWCHAESFGDYEACWLLEPVEARVATIKDIADLQAFQDTYYRPKPEWLVKADEDLNVFRLGYLIDYEKAAEDFDAIWIPNPHPYRLTMETVWFNTMDVESTLWFRWKFESVQKLDLPSPHRQCGAWTYHIDDARAVCRLTLGHEGTHKSGYFATFEWSDSFTRHVRSQDGYRKTAQKNQVGPA
jgi:hypothetical protein